MIYLEIIVNIFVAAAAITAAVVAVKGLQSWKKQKRADVDIYLLRSLVIAWVALQGEVRGTGLRSRAVLETFEHEHEHEHERNTIINELASRVGRVEHAITAFISAATEANIMGKSDLSKDLLEILLKYRKWNLLILQKSKDVANSKSRDELMEFQAFWDELENDLEKFKSCVNDNFTSLAEAVFVSDKENKK